MSDGLCYNTFARDHLNGWKHLLFLQKDSFLVFYNKFFFSIWNNEYKRYHNMLSSIPSCGKKKILSELLLDERANFLKLLYLPVARVYFFLKFKTWSKINYFGEAIDNQLCRKEIVFLIKCIDNFWGKIMRLTYFLRKA